jgi:iron complex outermembrane receptor protein
MDEFFRSYLKWGIHMSSKGLSIECLIAAAVGIAIAAARPATAQEAIQEVVVTAQKREENLQSTPIAISALSGDALQKRGVTDFAGIARTSPSINFTPYPSSNNTLILYMRGQGVSDPNQITADGSVALYQDGFYISRPQLSTFDLADVERVEVLRGPQGTLYGRNTTGGAVNIISRKPSGELDFKENLGFGNRGYMRSLTAIDLPKVGGLSSKVTLLYSNRDGFVKNPGPGEDFGKDRQKAGRVSLRWQSSENFAADYFYERGDLDSTPNYYQNPGLNGKVPGYVSSGEPNGTAWRPVDLPLGNGKYDANGLTLTWNLGAAMTFKSLTSYRGLDSTYTQDYADAFTDPTTVAFTGPVGFRTFDIVHSHSFTQEFQLVGDVGKRLKYVSGIYYFQEGASHFERVSIPIPAFLFYQTQNRFVAAEAKSRALYAQTTWTPPVLDDRLDLTFGARYTKDDRAATRNVDKSIAGLGVIAQETGASNDQHFSKFNPAFTANFGWTSDINTYLRIATGYKAGGSSESGGIGTFGRTFGPEKVTTYELGLKSYWLDRRVRLNAAAFQSRFSDMQLAFNTTPADLSIVLSQNAGKATVNGLELELLTLPFEGLNLSVDYTYLDPQIKEVTALAGTVFDPQVNPASPYKVGQNVAPVFQLPYAPKGIVNVSADYTFLHTARGSLSTQLNYRWQDRQYTTAPVGPAVPNSDLNSVPPYGVLDARLTWNLELANQKSARISLWGLNVTNERYPAHVIGGGNIVPFPGQVPGTTVGPGYYYQSIAWAEKPRYGIDLIYGF